VCEKILRDFKYELPGMGVAQFVVDGRMIEKPGEVLAELLEAGREHRGREQAAAVVEFAEHFTRKYGVRMKFTDEAIARVIEKAGLQKVSVAGLCERLFKDYEFGLKLLHRSEGSEFLITPEAIDDPDKFLSDWLVRTYRSV